MKNSLVFFSLLVSSSIFSQVEIHPELANKTVLIEVKNFGSGTGIYLQDSNFLYFVTALHVIYDKKKNQLPCDSVFLITYRKDPSVDKPDTLFMSLCDAGKNGYLQIDLKNDVAIIKLATYSRVDSLWSAVKYLPHASRISAHTKVNSFTYTMSTKRISDVKTGNDVFLFGYPKSLSLQFSFDFNRPLLRRGFVAGKDLRFNRIIIDCPSFQGNSGGPVYTIFLNDDKLYLIGLISEFIPFEENWYNDKFNIVNKQVSNSGYSVVVPIQAAIDLIPKLK